MKGAKLILGVMIVIASLAYWQISHTSLTQAENESQAYAKKLAKTRAARTASGGVSHEGIYGSNYFARTPAKASRLVNARARYRYAPYMCSGGLAVGLLLIVLSFVQKEKPELGAENVPPIDTGD